MSSEGASGADRPAEDKYPEWLKTVVSDKSCLDNGGSRYETIGRKILYDVQNSTVWDEIVRSLPEWNDEFALANKVQLFPGRQEPKLVLKPFESILNKTYRKNIVDNPNWPSPRDQDAGWITPENWYAQINDVVRTTLLVKYLDGVKYLIERLCEIATNNGHRNAVDFQAREEGYYAAHFCFWIEVEIIRPDWTTELVPLRVEVQVATQLQDAIRILTHDYYEQRRSAPPAAEEKWQWDYSGSQFIPNYLGHILHYVEGMIMQVRNRKDAK